jgi:cell division protein FtsB
MSPGLAAFIIVMTSIVVVGSLIKTWITTRHKTPAAGDALAATREVELLSAENANLKGQVGRLEERLAVLERIATDPAERTAREIEQLRHNP